MYLGKHFFLVFFIERQDFIDILFHAFSSDEHEVKYDDQYTDIDRKAADSSHKKLSDGRQDGSY